MALAGVCISSAYVKKHQWWQKRMEGKAASCRVGTSGMDSRKRTTYAHTVHNAAYVLGKKMYVESTESFQL